MVFGCQKWTSLFFFLPCLRFLFFAWFYHSKNSGSGFWQWAENCKNNLRKKKIPELSGIACRHVSFWFGRLSKILDERNSDDSLIFTLIFSYCPLQNSTSLPTSPKTLDSLLERGTGNKNKNAIFVIVFDVPIETTQDSKILLRTKSGLKNRYWSLRFHRGLLQFSFLTFSIVSDPTNVSTVATNQENMLLSSLWYGWRGYCRHSW